MICVSVFSDCPSVSYLCVCLRACQPVSQTSKLHGLCATEKLLIGTDVPLKGSKLGH